MELAKSIVYFYIPGRVTLLDLSGVLQVFEEAKILGFNYQVEFISNQSTPKSSSGLKLYRIKTLRGNYTY
nr:hypothetical protein [uncultured Draconibacterium sp.]